MGKKIKLENYVDDILTICRQNQKLFLIIFLAGLLFFPLVSQAAGLYEVKIFDDKDKDGKYEPPDETIVKTQIAYYDGLIPCEKLICFHDSSDKLTQFEKKRKEHMKDYIQKGEPQPASKAFQTACTDIGGTLSSKNISCKFCHFPVTLLGIINFLILPPTGIVFIIAVLLLMAGGAMFVFSAGRPAMAGQAKKIMTATVIGLVIIYASWLIVNTFLIYIDVSQNFEALQPNKWNEVMFNCPIYVPEP